jgi:hypothetical protein
MLVSGSIRLNTPNVILLWVLVPTLMPANVPILLTIGADVTIMVAVPVLSFTLNFLKNTDIINLIYYYIAIVQQLAGEQRGAARSAAAGEQKGMRCSW